jgi:hypothetical protein
VSRAGKRIAVIALAAALVAVLLTRPAAEARQPRRGQLLTGAYTGAGSPAALSRFDRSLGAHSDVASDYVDWNTWTDISRPTWWLRRWEATARTRHMVYGVPLLPRSGGALAEAANGAYDRHFRALARVLVRHRQGDATLRLGWEFNGGNRDPWYVGTTGQGPARFARYWRRIVRAMRSVRGARFTFDFNVSPGPGGDLAERAWPGDAYVDFVGVDVYDMAWAPDGGAIAAPAARWRWIVHRGHGLAFWARFAARHHKALSLPEWGLWNGPHGGGDDPYFVTRLRSWSERHGVAYASYFDASSARLTPDLYPRSIAAYRRGWS